MTTPPTRKEINDVLERLESDKSGTHRPAIDPDYDFATAPRHLRRVVYASTVWFCYRRWWARLLWWRK
jgi:hypothetical protein